MKAKKDKLQNAPLVEAIFEFRWRLKKTEGALYDPNYKLLPGAIYEKVRKKFPFHEQMPASQIPDELAAYTIQHRFRRSQNNWPLIQLGPGLLTLNDTTNYVWRDFKENITYSVKNLLDVYPESTDRLIPQSLTLRYIDAVKFNFIDDNVFKFLRNNLKFNLSIDEDIIKECEIDKKPLGFDIKTAFSCAQPKGFVELRFRRGENKGEDAIIWDTVIHSSFEDQDCTFNDTINWLEQAHDLTHRLFFKMIEGELRSRFE